MKKKAFEKRVKRRVNARKQRFFAVCSPGLNSLCHREIQSLLPEMENADAMPGGVEFSGSIDDCFAANLHLRSPSRIIMRIAAFKAENFRTLEKKLSQVPWELYLKKGADLTFDVSNRRSRLYHTDAVAGRARDVVLRHLSLCDSQSCCCDETALHKIFIRGIDDHFEISLDSSGELLHKRGLKDNVGAAPLRETLAFSILAAAGYSGHEPLIDPMCGSGSFCLEGAMMSCLIPAGLYRDFAFRHWPCFSSKKWEFMKKKAEGLIKIPDFPYIFASDIDEHILESLNKILEKFNLSSSIKVFKNDFFDLDPETLTRDKGLVVLNPPYGRRIGQEPLSATMFRDIGKKLKSDFRGWRAAVIVPDKRLLKNFPHPSSVIPLFHGGLDLNAAVIRL